MAGGGHRTSTIVIHSAELHRKAAEGIVAFTGIDNSAIDALNELTVVVVNPAPQISTPEIPLR